MGVDAREDTSSAISEQAVEAAARALVPFSFGAFEWQRDEKGNRVQPPFQPNDHARRAASAALEAAQPLLGVQRPEDVARDAAFEKLRTAYQDMEAMCATYQAAAKIDLTTLDADCRELALWAACEAGRRLDTRAGGGPSDSFGRRLEKIAGILTLPHTGQPQEGEDYRHDNPMFNRGVTHTVELLANELGVTDWVAGDGSEDYDEDLRQTLLNIIEAKGLHSSEDGSWAVLPAAPRAGYAKEGPSEVDMRAFSASDAACYLWPEDTDEHKALRAAYIRGAAACAPLPPVAESGWQLLPVDDPTREHANSALPIDMILAGADALERCQDDLKEENYISGETPDWDSGMTAVAIYRAMTAVASIPSAGRIATEIELAFKPLVMGQCISDWTIKLLVETAQKATERILALPAPPHIADKESK